MTIDAIASNTRGSLQMSAERARDFLTKLRTRSPVVAVGDEGGTVEIAFATTQAGPVFSINKPGVQDALHHCRIDPRFDMERAVDELLADLGA